MVEKLFCVILVNYNGFNDTQACLQSIIHTQGELPLVVLVDNASTEDADLEDLHQVYPKLKIIYNQENIGFGRANNVGIQWAQENLEFEFLLLLNNDTLIEPDTLFYLQEAFKANPEIGITTGKTLYEGNRDLVWYGGGDINYKRGWPKIADYNQKPTPEGADKAKYVSFVSGCVMLFTKESITTLKGFDEDFFMYCEDLELCMRAKKQGVKLYYEPRAVIYHKVQGSIKNKNMEAIGMRPKNPNLEFLFFHMKSNQYHTMRKNLPRKGFYRFNFNFWPEFVFKLTKLVLKGRKDMVLVGWKTMKNIFKGY